MVLWVFASSCVNVLKGSFFLWLFLWYSLQVKVWPWTLGISIPITITKKFSFFIHDELVIHFQTVLARRDKLNSSWADIFTLVTLSAWVIVKTHADMGLYNYLPQYRQQKKYWLCSFICMFWRVVIGSFYYCETLVFACISKQIISCIYVHVFLINYLSKYLCVFKVKVILLPNLEWNKILFESKITMYLHN